MLAKDSNTTYEVSDPQSSSNKHSEGVDSQHTPLPLSQLIPMVFVLLNESLCGSMIQPFSALLVAHLMQVPKNEAGYMSGLVVGVFCIGQVVSARTWGWLSDEYGRRFPLISGLFTSGLAMLGFGLSTNIYQLAFFRFLHGLFNGNVLVAKTMMADITDKTNEAKGFSFISLVSAIGFLLGPSLGGLLYDPVHSSTLSWVGFKEGGIFDTRPALLSSLFVFFYTMVGNAVCTFFVRESNPKAKPLPAWVKCIYPCLWVPAQKFIRPYLNADSNVLIAIVADEEDQSTREHSTREDEKDKQKSEALERRAKDGSFDTDSILLNGKDGTKLSFPSPLRITRRSEIIREGVPVDLSNCSFDDVDEEESPEPEYTRFGYKEAFQRPYTRFMLIQYMMIVFADTSLKECLNLWAISTTDAGGLNLSQESLSFILFMNSIPLMTANCLFHRLCGLFKDRMGLLRISVIVAGVAALNMPLGSYVGNFYVAMIYVLLSTSVRQLCCSWCYSLNTMLTARSAPPGFVGSIMGINQSCGAAMRAVAPLLASPVYAFSIGTKRPYPFNHVVMFYIAAIIFFITGYRSYRIRTNNEGKLELVQWYTRLKARTHEVKV